MPRRKDLRSILIVGSGPIRIGQGCEFDYAGVQACRVLREEGYRVVLVNSNPATIMTDPEWADATYLEPLDLPTVAAIVARERPDALLPTLGGQTALNLAVELSEAGVLAEYGVEPIGANLDAIRRAEDRQLFRETMRAADLPVPHSVIVTSLADLDEIGLPAVVRPSFTLGGGGGGIARTQSELHRQVELGLRCSPISQVLVERSLEGWQEFELELVADTAGNCVVVCSIENLDPVGVHTGDSWTVAPQQTLPDGELQRLRDAAFTCIRAIGVATGGANVQFAYEPNTRELALIEMNPRVSRSSALASKATGFPIAKLAALLAVGYTLDELPNDITRSSSAAFEPALDYVAVKAPRFDFARFPGTDTSLGTEMRAVGEALGLGRTFPEAMLKALEGIEAGDALPTIPGLHPYFAAELESIEAAERELATSGDVAAAKRFGLPDARIARLLGIGEPEVRSRRGRPGRLAVDSCAGEFEAHTPYYYLSYEKGDNDQGARPESGSGRLAGAPHRDAASSVAPIPTSIGAPCVLASRHVSRAIHRDHFLARPLTPAGAIVVLGSGTNRIGQGIEFDYCCVRAAQAFRRLGHEVVLVNSNPETVSTDYDTCDRLYLEPVTLERVLDVVELERPLGVVVSLGGQTPLGLAAELAAEGVPLLGEPLTAIEAAEDRGRFGALLGELGLRAPEWATASTTAEARTVAAELGYPVLVRPSYVIGGTGMRVARGPEELELAGPALVDRFLEGALELDVDILCDGSDAWVAAIVEHVERAGVHSGDSACVLPAPSITQALEAEIRTLAGRLAAGLGARGLLNLQLALDEGRLYVLEANPRASRTVPFVSKATGVPLVDHACRLLLGASLDELGLPERAVPERAWAKEAIFPAERFAGAADRGIEMRSTGEVMASGPTVVAAYRRALQAAGRARPVANVGPPLPRSGLRDTDALRSEAVALP
ncbi:MAG: carbamoyl-phosphate synthase large subunit [Gaiellaceae bacterium MAG52_C11]|nr:carbamoyl-phosphate synthase large subunit [Candidatus Gaiellasilicea maunaloa]